MCTHSHAHTHACTHTHFHTLTHAHTLSHMHIHTPSHTHTLSHMHTLSHKHIHSHAHTHSHSHTYTLTHAHHTHSLSHIHTHMHIHAHTHTHTHTHTHMLTYFWPKCLRAFLGESTCTLSLPRFHLVNFLQPRCGSLRCPPPSPSPVPRAERLACLPTSCFTVSPQWTESAGSPWGGLEPQEYPTLLGGGTLCPVPGTAPRTASPSVSLP